MPFAYYARLSKAGQALYRKSDEIRAIRLHGYLELRPLVDLLQGGLGRGDATAVRAAAQDLASGIARNLGAPAVSVEVLDVRPRSREEELHGLYTLSESGRARIRVWMRTARKGQVVAWKTFLRTLLHEVCHHIDFTHFGFDESFHTEGFFKRESSLFRQLVGATSPKAPPPAPTE